jgi:hypothetical protein
MNQFKVEESVDDLIKRLEKQGKRIKILDDNEKDEDDDDGAAGDASNVSGNQRRKIKKRGK